jgi:hypothetical protein
MGIGGAPSAEFGFLTDIPYLVELVREGETLLANRVPSSWPTFLAEVAARRPRFAKVQVPGPLTQPHDMKTRVREYVRALRALEVTPLVFIDEPTLGDPRALSALREVIHEEGALSGVHCCGQANWPEVFAMEFDVVSFDARLSIDALVEDRASWRRFVASGAWLAAGIIPTAPNEPAYRVDELVASLQSALGDFDRVLLTPACGLGLFSDTDARRVMNELVAAAVMLRACALSTGRRACA